MTPTHDAPAVLPLQAAPEAPTCPTAAPSVRESILAPWVRATCPNIRDGDRCVAEHARGRERCRLLLDKPRRCPWAERGPVLAAPEVVFHAYQSLIGPRWPRCLVQRPEPTPEAPPAPVAVPVAAPVVKPKPSTPAPSSTAGRLCPSCSKVELAPGRRVCDTCRAAARRATKARAQRKWRGTGVECRTVGPQGVPAPISPAGRSGDA